MSCGLTALAAGFLVWLVVLFIWQSLPVWRSEGTNFVAGKQWFYHEHQFGALPMIYGTVVVSLIALALAAPVGIGAALFSAEFIPARLRLALLARAAGETAPIMFTATIFAGATFPQAVRESPVLSLPYHIFILAQDSFDPSVGAKLWGTALTLLGVVLLLSICALPLRLKIHEEGGHG
jgi:ABC-type phosphate transport system permease subunit